MGFGLLNFVILFAIVWHKKFCDAATPNLTLTGKSELIVGENLTLTCAVNQDVDLLSVSFFREIIETIWISNPLPTPCTFYNLIPDDNSTYSTTCDPSKRNFTMTKYNLDTSDDNTVWFCQMKSVPGGNGTCVGTNNSCTSGNVTIHVSVKPSSSAPSNETQCKLELGLALGHGLGIPCVNTGVNVVIFIYTGYKHAYILGLELGVGLGGTFQVGWIIIASLISTGNKCKLELGLGLGLSSGMLYGIAYIVSVIFVFFMLSIFKDIPKRVELGKGILTGLLVASVIGIIVVYLIYDKLKRETTCTTHADNPPEPPHKKSKIKNSGPPVVHTGTQNKVEPNTIISKQTNDRQHVPPVDTGFEYRPQPQPPQNGEIKDRNLLRISATTEDSLGLANETHRPNRLLPLPPNKATVREEDASDEPKKKRKKKKKKNQMNKDTPEEQNGEAILKAEY